MPFLTSKQVIIFHVYPFISVNGKLTTNYYIRRQVKFEEDASIIKAAVKRAVDDSICQHSKYVAQETLSRMSFSPYPSVRWQDLNISASKISPLIDNALTAKSNQISEAIAKDVYSQLWAAEFINWFSSL